MSGAATALFVVGCDKLTWRLLSTSNIVTHRVLSGDYTEFCPWLVSALAARNLWTEEIRLDIIRHHGTFRI